MDMKPVLTALKPLGYALGTTLLTEGIRHGAHWLHRTGQEKLRKHFADSAAQPPAPSPFASDAAPARPAPPASPHRPEMEMVLACPHCGQAAPESDFEVVDEIPAPTATVHPLHPRPAANGA